VSTEHLLVETQSAWAGPGCDRFLRDAVALSAAGHPVCLFLVQDGVLAALDGASPPMAELLASGAQVWVDGFSLAARALRPAGLRAGVTVVDMAAVAAKLLEPDVRVVWR
jgi:sulfur relay (sulfurtransferase) DsrF/TusC family protein